jgi:hypothetical protein
MSTEPEQPEIRTEPRAAAEGSQDLLTDSAAEQRADVEEDRRRQRDLDDGELGGEG